LLYGSAHDWHKTPTTPPGTGAPSTRAAVVLSAVGWLKNCRPEQWRDKTQVETSWASKKLSEMTNEELDEAYLALQRLLPSPETVN
jgi:hypothetical protein